MLPRRLLAAAGQLRGARSVSSATTTSATTTSATTTSASAATARTKSGRLLDSIIRVDHAGELGADRIYAGQMAVLGLSCCTRGSSQQGTTEHLGSEKESARANTLLSRYDSTTTLRRVRQHAKLVYSLLRESAKTGKTSVGPTIRHMWDQEKQHRATFEELIRKYRVRPTALVPVWNVAGFLLGAGTALMGEKAAMACTVAVETVIVEHYNDQLRLLMESNDNDNDEKNVDQEILETIKKFRDEEQQHHDTGIDHGAEQAPFYKALTNVIRIGCKTAISISKHV